MNSTRGLACLLHGRASNPQSEKMQVLARTAGEHGFEAMVPDFSRTQDPEERLQLLLQMEFSPRRPLVFVGSSMGGYVATLASRQLKVDGLFLVAPAFRLYGLREPMPDAGTDKVAIIHGWEDEVVPCQNSIEFAQRSGARLYLIPGNHTLDGRLNDVTLYFSWFLNFVCKTT